MNYTIGVNFVDEAALLIALGYECTDYSIISTIDLNSDVAQKRSKTANYTFEDNSTGCRDYGKADDVIKGYKLPNKGKEIVSTLEAAKLAAHNYQVLKSVILEQQPLQQIAGKGYTMLKNANGDKVLESDVAALEGDVSSDIASIAIASALGCKVALYSITDGLLQVAMNAAPSGITLADVVEAKQKAEVEDTQESDYTTLAVLVAMFLNREVLLQGVYATKKLLLIRGSKVALIPANADNEIKQRIIKELKA